MRMSIAAVGAIPSDQVERLIGTVEQFWIERDQLRALLAGLHGPFVDVRRALNDLNHHLNPIVPAADVGRVGERRRVG